MVTFKTLLIIAIYAVVLFVGHRVQTSLASQKSPRPGLILPAVAWLVAVGLSINNFIITFEVQFSMLAFVASVMLFVFFAVPACYFSLLYVDCRKKRKYARLSSRQLTRQAMAQQRVKSNMDRRYQDVQKQEPIVFVPSGERKGRSTTKRPSVSKPKRPYRDS